MRLSTILGSLLIVSSAIGQPTAPQKPTKPMVAAAERHFRDGVQFTEEANYDAARIEFEAGYQLSSEPDFLHNLSWTAERQGKITDAIAYATRYLAEKPDADNAERTRRRIELLKAKLPAETAPARLAAQPVAAPKIATSASTGPTTPSSRGKVPPGAIGLLASGGALALAGVGCLAGSWLTGQQAQSPSVTFDEWTPLSDRGKTLSTAGITLTVIGGSVAMAGVVWAIVPHKEKQQPKIVSRLE